jgi:hypothetical protein
MAIDKIIPIRLDKSSDFKLVPTTSMVDALNMLITENESDGSDNGETGSMGVLKNVRGNETIEYLSGHAVADGNSKIIGSITDSKLKIIYFFVWHEIPSEHGVYAYDPLGKLPITGNTTGKIIKIHKSALYEFPEHGFVKGDVIYTSRTRLDDSVIKEGTDRDFEKDTILYFTDNTNEPRKINVYMAMRDVDITYGPADLIDFITACPKTPTTPISVTFDNDPSRTTSNFKSGPGFQFGYQFISKDGVESAISPYSDIAFSPSVINQGTLTDVDHNVYNRCKLMIPLGGEEIQSIRIVARQFNNAAFVIIDEVSNEESEGYNWNIPIVTSGIPTAGIAGGGGGDRGPDDPGEGFESLGCTDTFACNYDPAATENDGSCLYPDNSCYYLQFPDPSDCVPVYYGCSDPDACNYDSNANAPGNAGFCGGPDTCWYPPAGEDCAGGQYGCTDPIACNFTPGAVNDDGSCEYNSCLGCTDATACNYDPTATIEDGTCSYPAPNTDCQGESTLTNLGCTFPSACNYNPDATEENGSCIFPLADYDCDGNFIGPAEDFEDVTIGAGDCVAEVARGTYFFYNDRIVRGVSTNEVNKQYDNLPRKAQAQAVVDNRLMYGNYLEGFDKVKTSCTSTVKYQQRPPEGFDFKLQLVPAISQVKDTEVGEVYGKNKCAGYIVDASDVPYHIPPNTFVSVKVTVAPDKNFHVYNARNSYHQSRHRGAFSRYTENEFDYEALGTPQLSITSYGVDNSLHFDGYYGHQNSLESGEKWLQDTLTPNGQLAATFQNSGGLPVNWGIPYAGDNFGVVDPDNPPTWKTDIGGQSGTEVKVAYGTSAGNPFILSSESAENSGPLSFSCKFLFGANGVGAEGDGPQAITSIVSELLTKGYSNWGNLGGAGNPFITQVEINNKIVHKIDIGLSNFEKIYAGDPKENLVTGVVRTHSGIQDDIPLMTGLGRPADEIFRPPVGHFIVNKATVEIALERDMVYEGLINNNPTEMLRLVINKISNVEAVTVVKKIFPGAPWSVLKESYLGFNPNIAQFHDRMSLSNNFDITGTGIPIPNYEFDPSIGMATDGGIFELNTFEDFDYGNLNNISRLPGLLAVEGKTPISEGPLIQTEQYFPNLSSCLDKWTEAGMGLGYLKFQQNDTTHNFFNFDRTKAWQELIEDLQADGTETINLPNPGEAELFPFSLLDGEGGPGGDLGYKNEFQVPGLNGGPGAINFGGSDYRVMRVRRATLIGLNGVAPNLRVFSIQVQGPIFTGTINTRLIYSNTKELNYADDGSFATQSQIMWLPVNNIESTISENGFSIIGDTNIHSVARTSLPLLQGNEIYGLDVEASTILESQTGSWAYSSPARQFVQTPVTDSNGNENIKWSMAFDKLHSYFEIINITTEIGSVTTNGIGGDRTFKTSANHDFGVIYYDERGRHGFVDHLKTVYVAGYSSADRGNNVTGKSIIELKLNHKPPIWAHRYKIAYTKNTTVENFIQYSVGGAFPELEGGSSLTSKTNLYVSLNYLQWNPISYVDDWGARDPEGGVNMFKYIPGANQKVRVISTYTDSESKLWPYNYEFDIIDMVLLGDTDNPIMEIGMGDENPDKMGQFLVLRNNPSAEGFDYTSIVNDNNRWNNNCIVEIFTPQKRLEDENRFYYEIGHTYDVIDPGEISRQHQNCPVVLDQGDVWWRKVPVNLRNYGSFEFTDLIQPTADNAAQNDSSSNFKPIYLETETATDLFKGNASFIGRPNIIREDTVEVIREASITYSGKSNPDSSKVNYSSFNYTLSNFKDLQEEFGDINYICNMEGDVFVIQSDRCTLVPASKTLFSDVQGTSTVAASKSPLGQEKVFAGRAGCDNNPESIVQVGTYIYFAHKKLGKVYRFNPSNGIQEISEQGMASYFRGVFKDAMDKSTYKNYDDVRVVGGFDPVNDEYLLTILDPLTYDGSTEYEGGEGATPSAMTTINSLEEQLHNVLEAFLSTNNGSGSPVFDITALPQKLQDFYNSPITSEIDFAPFDDSIEGELGVFDTSEVLSAADIYVGIQTSINDLINSNPGLNVSLQQVLDNNSIVTGADLLAWVESMVPEVGGLYNTIDEAIAGEGISLNYISEILNRLAEDGSSSYTIADFNVARWKADLDLDQSVGSSDLLIFLSSFGIASGYNTSFPYLKAQNIG